MNSKGKELLALIHEYAGTDWTGIGELRYDCRQKILARLEEAFPDDPV